MLFRSNDTATTEIYTVYNTLSLHDALPIFVTMLASSWPMNAPKQTTLMASHGAPRLSRTTAGRGCSRKILLLANIWSQRIRNTSVSEYLDPPEMSPGRRRRGAGRGARPAYPGTAPARTCRD